MVGNKLFAQVQSVMLVEHKRKCKDHFVVFPNIWLNSVVFGFNNRENNENSVQNVGKHIHS